MTLKAVTTRFNAEEEALLARTVELLRQRNPDLEPTRSDAVRFLVASSASAVAGNPSVALSHQPTPISDPRKDRAART